MNPVPPFVVATLLSLVAESLAHDDVLVGAAATAFGVGAGALLARAARRPALTEARFLLALSFGTTAVFTTVAFWSALPFGLGAAALATAVRPVSLAGFLGAAAMLIGSVFCIVA